MKRKFPKYFKTENSFKRYLKKNKNYVLNMFCEGPFWYDKKYICDSHMVLSAVKYAIGRKTGTVIKIVEWVLSEWNNLDQEERIEIVKEILRYEENNGNLGYDWHREIWYRIVNKEMIGWIDELG